MITLYFAAIYDHAANHVLSLEYTATAKHAAFLGQRFVREVPPAMNFRIHKRIVSAREACALLNSVRK